MQAGAVFSTLRRRVGSQPRHQTVLGRKAHPPTTGVDLETFRTAGSAQGHCLLWANHIMRRCLGRRHQVNFLTYIALLTFTMRASTPLQASRKAASGSQRQCVMLPGALCRMCGWYEIGKLKSRKQQTIEAHRRRDLLCCSSKFQATAEDILCTCPRGAGCWLPRLPPRIALPESCVATP